MFGAPVARAPGTGSASSQEAAHIDGRTLARGGLPQPLRSRPPPARCRFRSPKFLPRSTGRSAEPPASPRVPGRRRSSRRRGTGLQGSIPSDPGIRGPLHPLRLRYPPSPYRCGYASVGRLAGSGASTLSVHGLFRNESLEAGVRLSLRRAGVSHGEPRTEPPLRRSPPEQRYTAADGGGCGARSCAPRSSAQAACVDI